MVRTALLMLALLSLVEQFSSVAAGVAPSPVMSQFLRKSADYKLADEGELSNTADGDTKARRLEWRTSALGKGVKLLKEALENRGARKAAEKFLSPAAHSEAVNLAAGEVDEQTARALVGKATKAAKTAGDVSVQVALSGLGDIDVEECKDVLANVSEATKVNMTIAAAEALDSASGAKRHLSAKVSEEVVEAVVEDLAERLFDCGEEMEGSNRTIERSAQAKQVGIGWFFGISIMGALGLLAAADCCCHVRRRQKASSGVPPAEAEAAAPTA